MDYKQQIDKARLPRHIAIIMDGNGRWAKKQGLARMFGHKQGGTWMIKNPDGKEVEIWQFLKDYAKECTQNNAEIDVYMSDVYYDYSGVSLKHYAAKFSRNTYRQVREREYSR